MCRCLACNAKLSSRELTRKYANLPEGTPPEDQYIGLCTPCFNGSDIVLAVSNPTLPDNDGEISDIYWLTQEQKAPTHDPFNDDDVAGKSLVIDKDYSM